MFVASSVKLEIEKALSTQEAKYHFRAPLVRVWRIPRHSLDSEATEVFSNSKIPSILIVALALTSNIHGDISKREREHAFVLYRRTDKPLF